MNIQHKSLLERIRTRDLRVLDRGPFAYTVSNAIHYGLRAALRRQVPRDKAWIHDEYHVSKRAEHWRDNLSLDDLIMSDNQTKMWILKDGEITIGTERVIREYNLARLRDWIKKFLPDGRGRVVEFGCGTGRNLFYLARTFPDLELVGLELSPSSVEHAQQTAKREGFRISFQTKDMTGDCSDVAKADVVFSIHALEQLPSDFPKAFDNMMKVSRGGIVLFEPVHELFPWSLRGIAARFRLRNANYLNGLLSYVKSKRELEVEHAAAMPYGNPLNPTVELVTRQRA